MTVARAAAGSIDPRRLSKQDTHRTRFCILYQTFTDSIYQAPSGQHTQPDRSVPTERQHSLAALSPGGGSPLGELMLGAPVTTDRLPGSHRLMAITLGARSCVVAPG